ncbi:MAG TPA: T9SS type A sorting domain-containing protein [Candidatus Kapabacteria bacterium]|nr:T9SS type A sorting domain-containing protein [Candidatus Kapabacteria bacterium]
MRHSSRLAIRLILLGIGIGCALPNQASAQWTQVKGPAAISMSQVYAFGDNLYVRTDSYPLTRRDGFGFAYFLVESHLYTSADSGRTFRDFSFGALALDVPAFAHRGNDLLTIIPGAGVLYSYGGFLYWQIVDTLVPHRGGLNGIASVRNKIFVSCNGYGIQRFNDTVGHWTLLDTGLTSKNISVLSSYADTLFAGTADSGIYRSTDLGKHWVNTSVGLTDRNIYSIVSNNNIILSMTRTGEVYCSTDNGNDWKLIFTDTLNHWISSIALDSAAIFVSPRKGGLFRSTDSGATWVALDAALTRAKVNSISATKLGVIVATDVGLFRSDDEGDNWSWVQIKNGVFYTSVFGMAVLGDTIFAGSYGNGVFRTTDQGNTWAPIDNGHDSNNIWTMETDKDIVYTDYPLYKSTDRGDHWTYNGNAPIGAYPTSYFRLGDTVIVGTANGNIFISDDDGVSWSQKSSLALAGGSNIYAVLYYNGILYASSRDDGIYRSTDFGNTWSLSLDRSVGDFFMALTAHGNVVLAANDKGIYRTTDEGVTWDTLLDYVSFEALQVVGNIIFAAGDGIYISTDDGATWSVDQYKIQNNAFASFVVGNDGFLYAGSNYLGVWRRPIPELRVNMNISANESNSEQNYPNPFSSRTTIGYTLERGSPVSIVIYNALGVDIFHHTAEYESLGRHSVVWDATAFANGVYECHITADGVNESRKMILRK